jgi:hypothetical protein
MVLLYGWIADSINKKIKKIKTSFFFFDKKSTRTAILNSYIA